MSWFSWALNVRCAAGQSPTPSKTCNGTVFLVWPDSVPTSGFAARSLSLALVLDALGAVMRRPTDQRPAPSQRAARIIVTPPRRRSWLMQHECDRRIAGPCVTGYGFWTLCLRCCFSLRHLSIAGIEMLTGTSGLLAIKWSGGETAPGAVGSRSWRQHLARGRLA